MRGVVLAAASAGKVPPDRLKPINAEMRQAIDGAGDMSLSEEQRLVYLRKAFFAPGNDPRVWLGGWHDKRMKHSPMHAIPHRSMTTSPLARPDPRPAG